MFGIVYTLFTSIACIFNKAKETQDNKSNRINFRNKDGLTYIDSKGGDRLLSNNHKAMYTKFHHSCYGDYILEDIETHTIVKNFSEEERVKTLHTNYQYAVDNNMSVYYENTNNYSSEFTFHGRRFIDINTKDVYVIRRFYDRYYFMDISNGFLIRETDYSLKNTQNNLGIGTVDMNEFNKAQQEKMRNYNWC